MEVPPLGDAIVLADEVVAVIYLFEEVLCVRL